MFHTDSNMVETTIIEAKWDLNFGTSNILTPLTHICKCSSGAADKLGLLQCLTLFVFTTTVNSSDNGDVTPLKKLT